MCGRRRLETLTPMADPKDVTEPGEIRDLTLDHTRGLRYAELFFVGPEWITVYNSMGLSEAPAELWDALDAEATAQRFGQQAVIKNGPHWWASDALTLRLGSIRSTSMTSASALRPACPQRGEIGKAPAPLLDRGRGGEGRVTLLFVRPARLRTGVARWRRVRDAIDDVEPGELQSLGERLSLADAWQFRIRPLEEDLTVSLNGKVRTVMDDLRNVYNGAALQA